MLRDFKFLLSARFLYTFATEMQAVVLGWCMYELTHDPLYLGLVGLAEAVPAIGLALVAGYIVDRSRPLRIYHGVVLVGFISGFVMLLSQIPQMNFSHDQQIFYLFLASLTTGLARGFSQPAIFAIVPRIIARDQLSKAAAWTTSTMQVARISGPALGGLIFGWFGSAVTGVVVCVFLILAQAALFLIQKSPEAPAQTGEKKSMGHELWMGASFVLKHPILFPAMTLDMVSVLFGGVTALLPIFASEILKVGARGLGILRAAPAIGAAISSLWLIRADIRAKAGKWLYVAVGGFGLSVLVFSLSENMILSVMALGLSGAFDSISMIVRGSAVQLTSPDNMRGRISAVNSIFIGSSNELGELESGMAAKLMGTMHSAVFGAVVCLLTVGVMYFAAPALRELDLRKLEKPT